MRRLQITIAANSITASTPQTILIPSASIVLFLAGLSGHLFGLLH